MIALRILSLAASAILSITAYIALAQQSAVPENVRAVNTIERLTDSNGLGANEMIYGLPLPPGKVIGDSYMSTNWRTAAMLLYDKDKLIEGVSIRYDIALDEIDINTSAGIKAMAGSKVRSFVWRDSMAREPAYFVNAKDFRYKGVPLHGFFQVICDGRSPLMKLTEIVVKRADYNPALNTGTRDDKLLRKSVFFMTSGNDVILLPETRKKLIDMFGARSEEMSVFIRKSGLNPKAETDLVAIFEHYNKLIGI